MAQVIIFTGTSRTNPKMFYDKADATSFVMNRPLGAYQIASILRDNGYTVQVIDRWHWMIREKGAEFYTDVIKKYISKDTLWIGWSNTFFEGKPVKLGDTTNIGYIQPAAEAVGMRNRGLEAFRNWRRHINPNIKFVVGGAKTWRWSQQDFKFFDYYVEGYADVMALELTNYLAGKGPKPITVKTDDGSEILNYDRRGDKFKFVNHKHNWHQSDHIEPDEALPIEISRGCIFRCAYCSFPLNGKKKLDFIRDHEPLKEEFIQNYEKYVVTKYYYSDDTHNDSFEKLEYLYNEVYIKLPFKIQFATYLRLDLLAAHPHTIPFLKESGLVGTFFGIESFNNKANKTVGKGATEERIYENLWKCKEVWKDQVHIHSGLIFGLPNDSEETIRDWCSRAIEKDSPIDWSMITELHLFPNFKKDAHWLNRMEMDPESFGYKFEADGVNWTNNMGLTKARAQELSAEFKEIMFKNKKGDRVHPKSWFSFAHASNLKMDTEEFLKTHPLKVLEKRDKILNDYFLKLKNGDPQ